MSAKASYFLPYQQRWINDNSPMKLYEKSRRVGITYATSYRCVLKCLKESQDSSFVQWVSSRDDITAREFVTDYVAMWSKKANGVSKKLADYVSSAMDLGVSVEVVDVKHGISAYVVKFKNGARIHSLSSNPMAFAGKGGDILLDEMDLHEAQEVLYAMAYPCITWGNQLEIVSAYSATGSEHTTFADLCRECKGENPKGFSFHHTDLDDAIREGFVEKVNEVKKAKGRPTQTRAEFRAMIRKGCVNQNAWLSQYMCIPNETNGEQMITKSDLNAAATPYEIFRLHLIGDAASKADKIDPSCEMYTKPDFWNYYFNKLGYEGIAFGYDIARTGDLSSIFINSYDSERLKYTLRVLVTLKNCKFESQRQIVAAMLDSCPLLVGCGDSTGMGMSTCEQLETEYSDRFKGINFSASKILLGSTMQSIYEQHRQALPGGHPEIAGDVAGIKKGATPSGKISFFETKNELLPDSHCDIAWSNALAILAGETIEACGPVFIAPAYPEKNYAESAYAPGFAKGESVYTQNSRWVL